MSIKSNPLFAPLLFILALTACNQSAPIDDVAPDKANRQAKTFVGCYGVEKNGLAQIKISEQAGNFVMQMKEPDGAKTPWDSPEPLDEISIDIERVLARPDQMMILAKLKDASQNINPLLDAPYVVYIFKGANTIYQVSCDDEPVNIIKDGKKQAQAFYQ